MKKWLLNQMDQQLIESNGPLGKAVNYLKKHWDGLMGFCQHEGARIDNKICYAARGIADLMPTPGLCRIGGLPHHPVFS